MSSNIFRIFYDKYCADNENNRARIISILDQVLRERVLIREIQMDYSIQFTEVLNARLDNLKNLSKVYDERHQRIVNRTKSFDAYVNQHLLKQLPVDLKMEEKDEMK